MYVLLLLRDFCRYNHAVFTIWIYHSTSSFLLMQNQFPKDITSQIVDTYDYAMALKAESLMTSWWLKG